MSTGAEQTSSRDTASQDRTATPPSVETASALVRVLDDYMADLQAGRAPDRGRLLADYPEIAAELEQCLAGIEFIHRAVGDPGGEPARLGDFRIIREVGRGGMGVVFEAEQAESLTRTVDHRTDVYSLGASLYELATGKPVFEAETSLAVIAKILSEEPVAPRQLRPGLPRETWNGDRKAEVVVIDIPAQGPGVELAVLEVMTRAASTADPA